MRPTLSVFLLCACLSCSAQMRVTPNSPEDSTYWVRAIEQDIAEIHLVLMQQHPGVHDPHHTDFVTTLDAARDAALGLAHHARHEADYNDALAEFSLHLSDGHALAFPSAPSPSSLRRVWPGFTTAWRDGGLVIARASTHEALVGARLLSCEGISLEVLVAQAMRSRYGRPDEAGQLWSRAPWAFVPLEHEPRPRTCVLMTPDGEKDTLELSWSEAPDDIFARITAHTDGDRRPIGVQEWESGIHWVAMPSFSPDEQGRASYDALFEKLEEIEDARALVLDLRHNDGGSSMWSRRVAEIIWGEEQVLARQQKSHAGAEIWWRATPEHLDYITRHIPPHHVETSRGRLDLITAMQSAIARGAHYVKDLRPTPPLNTPSEVRDLPPIYVITSGSCASACLDAMDIFSEFDIVHVGAPTSADSTYMEVRLHTTSSKRARIVLPTKIWQHRPRKTKEVYTPELAHQDLDWSTHSLHDTIVADLERANR